MRRTISVRAAAIGGLALLVLWGAACGQNIYPDAFDPVLRDVNAIVNDADLSGQEKRRRLEELGIDALTINALLRADRTANQFGGDLRSAFDKVTEERFTELSADEIQLYADAASEAVGGPNFNLADDQAQAIVIFFGQNNLNSPDDVEAFLDDPVNEVPTTIPDNAVREIFVDFDPGDIADQLP